MPKHGSISLALGGGAARGWAHIGALRVLEEEGIAVGAVAGTSIGALAALCLAAGRLDALEMIARGTSRRHVLGYLDPHLRRGALLGGRRIARVLERHFADARLEALRFPVAIVAADLERAKEVRLASGPAIPAVQASMALPALFRPVVIGGRTLIDGGMVANVPVAAARALAPGLPVVAIDLMADYVVPTGANGGGRSALTTLRAAFLMMMAQQGRQTVALDRPEVLVAPAVGHVSTGAFAQADALIHIGGEAMRAALPAIRRAMMHKD